MPRHSSDHLSRLESSPLVYQMVYNRPGFHGHSQSQYALLYMLSHISYVAHTHVLFRSHHSRIPGSHIHTSAAYGLCSSLVTLPPYDTIHTLMNPDTTSCTKLVFTNGHIRHFIWNRVACLMQSGPSSGQLALRTFAHDYQLTPVDLDTNLVRLLALSGCIALIHIAQKQRTSEAALRGAEPDAA